MQQDINDSINSQSSLMEGLQRSVRGFNFFRISNRVYRAGKDFVASLLEFGNKFSHSLVGSNENVDALRIQIGKLQQEIRRLQVEKANTQFKYALAGTLTTDSSASVLGKRKASDSLCHQSSLACEGRKLLQSIKAFSSHVDMPTKIDRNVSENKKLSLLLPNCCPIIDIAHQNAQLNSSVALNVGDNLNVSSVTASTTYIAYGPNVESDKKRRRRVSFGRDDVREVEKYIGNESSDSDPVANHPHSTEESTIVDDGNHLPVISLVNRQLVTEEESEGNVELQQKKLCTMPRSLPFGVQDLLGTSLRPLQKRRLSFESVSVNDIAPINDNNSVRKPLAFNANDILQVKLRPLQKQSVAKIPNTVNNNNLQDTLRAALMAKFAKTVHARPDDDSDTDWI